MGEEMQGNFMYNNSDINHELKRIAIDSTNFLLNNPQAKQKKPIDLYNQWSRENDISINNTEISNWTLEHIATMKNVDTNLLEEALRLDLN